MISGRGPLGKAIVFGLLDRDTGKVHAEARRTRGAREHLHRVKSANAVEPGARRLNTNRARSLTRDSTSTLTRSLTTPKLTLTARSTRTGWRTTGVS